LLHLVIAFSPDPVYTDSAFYVTISVLLKSASPETIDPTGGVDGKATFNLKLLQLVSAPAKNKFVIIPTKSLMHLLANLD
jgi:hypothetical protein